MHSIRQEQYNFKSIFPWPLKKSISTQNNKLLCIFLAHLFGENRLSLKLYKLAKVVYELVDETLFRLVLKISLTVVKCF